MKIELETFKDLSGGYSVNELIVKEPSCINFLRYRKYKVTIELIEEPVEVLIERLNSLDTATNHHRIRMVKDEIKKLQS